MQSREQKIQEEWVPAEWLKTVKYLIESNNFTHIPACLAEIKNQHDRIEKVCGKIHISTEGISSAEAFNKILSLLTQRFQVSKKIQSLFVLDGMKSNEEHLRYAITQLDVNLVRLILKNSDSFQDPFDGLNFSFFSHPYVDKPILARKNRLQIAKHLIENLPAPLLATQNKAIGSVLRLCATYCDETDLDNIALIKLLARHTDCLAALKEPDTDKFTDLLLQEICRKQENKPNPNFRNKMENALDAKRFRDITDLALFTRLLTLMGGLTLQKYQMQPYSLESSLKDKPEFLQAIHAANKQAKNKVVKTKLEKLSSAASSSNLILEREVIAKYSLNLVLRTRLGFANNPKRP